LAILRPLSVRDFRLFWTALVISLVGDGIYYVAMTLQLLELENSPASIALSSVALVGGQILMFFVGAGLADRCSRRNLMIISDWIRLGALATLTVLVVSGEVQIWHIVVLSGVYGIGDGLFGPLMVAFITQVVPERFFVQANALVGLVKPVGLFMVGPALGGLIVAIGNAGSAFAIEAATFALSIFLLSQVANQHTKKPGGKSAAETVREVVGEIREGFDFVRSQRWLWMTLFSATIVMFAYSGPSQTIVPYLLSNEIASGADNFGMVKAVGGLGALLVSLVVSSLSFPRRFMVVIFCSWSVATGAIALLAFAANIWQAMAVMFLSQGALVIGTIFWNTVIQKHVPDNVRGRVASLDWCVSVALLPVSLLLIEPITSLLGERVTLVMGGLVSVITLIAVLVAPGVRTIESRQKQREIEELTRALERTPYDREKDLERPRELVGSAS
jgi:MFS family permease